jgi:HEPN domain-containing protein
MQKHEQWLAYANDDLKTALILLAAEEVIVASILFHAQQCAEKALKAYLVCNNVPFKRTHDLVELVNNCSDFDLSFISLTDIAAELSPFATESRYPDSCLIIPYIPTAETSVRLAQGILTFVTEKLDERG